MSVEFFTSYRARCSTIQQIIVSGLYKSNRKQQAYSVRRDGMFCVCIAVTMWMPTKHEVVRWVAITTMNSNPDSYVYFIKSFTDMTQRQNWIKNKIYFISTHFLINVCLVIVLSSAPFLNCGFFINHWSLPRTHICTPSYFEYLMSWQNT